jgi:hypothetical protein
MNYLPIPNEEELNMTGKSEYFTRLLDMDLHKKLKIELSELTKWIHHNYTSVFILEKELSYNEFKKLIK